MIDKIQNNYKNIENLIYVNAAVFSRREKITLYKANKAKDYSHTGWAAINLNRFKDTDYEKNYAMETVQGIPLMEIIRENNFETVDLLQIDTEGYDAEVIKMFDFIDYIVNINHFFKLKRIIKKCSILLLYKKKLLKESNPYLLFIRNKALPLS